MPQKEMTPHQMRQLFHKLRQLTDCEIAVLAAWRDLVDTANRMGADVVPPDAAGALMAIPTHAINDVRWLVMLSPDPITDGPSYWDQWQEGVAGQLVEHLTESIRLLSGHR